MVAAPEARSLLTHEALRAWAGAAVRIGAPRPKQGAALRIASPLASALPDEGFPRGSVVELASPANLGHGLGVALAACAASQRASVARGGEMAWCAILDPDHTLFGPAVQASGVCLERLLVLRPPRHLLAKVAVRVALSRIFSVIVVDVASIPGAAVGRRSPAAHATVGAKAHHRFEAMETWSKVTRRLALAVEKTPTTLFLLTRSEAARASALPA